MCLTKTKVKCQEHSQNNDAMSNKSSKETRETKGQAEGKIKRSKTPLQFTRSEDTTFKMDHTTEVLEEDKETKFLSVDSVNQKIQEAKEEEEKDDIIGAQLVNNKAVHLVQLIVTTNSEVIWVIRRQINCSNGFTGRSAIEVPAMNLFLG